MPQLENNMPQLILKTSYREGILLPDCLSDSGIVRLMLASKVKKVDDVWVLDTSETVEIVVGIVTEQPKTTEIF